MTSNTAPTGVLLYNLGGPANLEAVEPFLLNLFSDREIIRLPFGAHGQSFFAWVIAKVRGPSVRRNYSLIGGGSPQLRITRAQAAALKTRLNGASKTAAGTSNAILTGTDNRVLRDPASRRFRVLVAMRYSRPSATDALSELEAAGVRRIVLLTLFPQWSKATTGSWQRQFDRVLESPRWQNHRFDISGIDRYADDPAYLDALADTVRRGLESFSREGRRRAVILFSAHGLPQKFIDDGDPYVDQIQATRRGVLERLGVSNREMLGFQSRTGPVKWIGPGTDELIGRLGAEGVRQLLIVPLSFVSDHIETLYELDILFEAMARKAGVTDYRRSAALNTCPLFIEALARLVERHLADDSRSSPAPGREGAR